MAWFDPQSGKPRLREAAKTIWIVAAFLAASGAQAQEASPVADLPDLSVAPSAGDAKDFDKYFVFHRPATSLDTARDDLAECGAYASGLTLGTGQPQLGGMMLAGIAGAIASGNRASLRRVNWRRCMFFKGYGRYGVARAAWQKLNSANTVDEAAAHAVLLRQAAVASGPVPAGKDLGE
jgi:hypothetical protein